MNMSIMHCTIVYLFCGFNFHSYLFVKTAKLNPSKYPAILFFDCLAGPTCKRPRMVQEIRSKGECWSFNVKSKIICFINFKLEEFTGWIEVLIGVEERGE